MVAVRDYMGIFLVSSCPCHFFPSLVYAQNRTRPRSDMDFVGLADSDDDSVVYLLSTEISEETL